MAIARNESRHLLRNGSRNVWGYIERRDHRLMRKMNRWRAPRWIRYWMIAATRAGDGWLWYGLGAMLMIYGGAQRFEAVGAASLAALTGVLIFKAIKKISQRPRPCQFEPHCWSKVLPPDQFSFPSGHTMTAFSVALVVSYFYPSLEGALFFLAISIAVSRVVLGMHFLSDVLAGVVLGVALGCAAITAFASLGLV
jgi:undecaprenyl-diphosphatase